MASKVTTVEEAVSRIQNGSSLLVGGFYGLGTPHALVAEIVRQGKRDLTLYTVEGGQPGYGVSRLLEGGCVRKLVASWFGNNKALITSMVNAGTLELEINPQGTLVERIRSGGYGLGGVLTPTGLGTYIEEQGIGKRVAANGRDWLYHSPITADVAIVEAERADTAGNLVFRGAQANYGPTLCTAADLVIATVLEPIGEAGSIQPEHVHVPGLFVDLLVQTASTQQEALR